MRDIIRFRNIADYLLKEGNTLKAYELYYRLNLEIWLALAKFKNEIKLTPSFLVNKEDDELLSLISLTRLKKIFFERFKLHVSQVIDEFVFITYGRLKCIFFSEKIKDNVSPQQLNNDILLLYILINNPDEIKCINKVFEVFNPVVKDDTLSLIKIIADDNAIEKMLFNYAEKNLANGFNSLNHISLLLLENKDLQKTRLMEGLRELTKKEKKLSLEGFANLEGLLYNRTITFNPKIASESEKAVHYGKVLGLIGKIKKSEIRSKYYAKISIYHPDKVKNPSPEVLKQIETKTKEINEAFEYFKEKYNL